MVLLLKSLNKGFTIPLFEALYETLLCRYRLHLILSLTNRLDKSPFNLATDSSKEKASLHTQYNIERGFQFPTKFSSPLECFDMKFCTFAKVIESDVFL